MPQISFAADIKPLFRTMDISHMKPFGVELDDYTYMSNPDNANSVYATLAPHGAEPPSMPPGGPYWTPAQLELFVQWQKDGYQP
jgi:hypothetical protein